MVTGDGEYNITPDTAMISAPAGKSALYSNSGSLTLGVADVSKVTINDYYSGGEDTYTVTIDSAVTNGMVTADKDAAAEGNPAVHKLYDIGSLALSDGAKYFSDAETTLNDASVAVPAGTELDLSEMDEEISINNFTGGGTLTFSSRQMLIINGAVSGTTIVNVTAAGDYITAENSVENSFALADNSNFDKLTRGEGGAPVGEYKISITIPADSTVKLYWKGM